MIRVERFGDKIVGAALDRFHGPLDGSIGGDHNNGQIGISFFDFAQNFDAVHAGHLVVEQNQVRESRGETLQRGPSAVGFYNGIAELAELLLEQIEIERLVIDQEYGLRHWNYPPRPDENPPPSISSSIPGNA